jgi:hypothetical protein
VFSNNVLLGIPLAKVALGEAALPSVALVLVFNSLTLWTLVTVSVEWARHGSFTAHGFVKTLKAVLTTPIVASILSGTLFGLSGLPVPELIDQPLAMVATAAAPLAMIVLGMGLAEYPRGLADQHRDHRGQAAGAAAGGVAAGPAARAAAPRDPGGGVARLAGGGSQRVSDGAPLQGARRPGGGQPDFVHHAVGAHHAADRQPAGLTPERISDAPAPPARLPCRIAAAGTAESAFAAAPALTIEDRSLATRAALDALFSMEALVPEGAAPRRRRVSRTTRTRRR